MKKKSYHLIDAELAAFKAVNDERIYPFRKQEFIKGFLEGRQIMTYQESFDNTIGRLDRVLSLLLEREDEANRQTLKHHADDLIGVGQKMHQLLEGDQKKVVGTGPPSKFVEVFKEGQTNLK